MRYSCACVKFCVFVFLYGVFFLSRGMGATCGTSLHRVSSKTTRSACGHRVSKKHANILPLPNSIYIYINTKKRLADCEDAPPYHTSRPIIPAEEFRLPIVVSVRGMMAEIIPFTFVKHLNPDFKRSRPTK